MKTFGQRLREARREAGLTQKQLATACGYAGQGGIGNLERRATTSSRHVAALARALKVNPLWLETGQGPKHATPGSFADSIREEQSQDGMALIEQGLRTLVIVGKAKDAILHQVREAATESQAYRELALAEFKASQPKP